MFILFNLISCVSLLFITNLSGSDYSLDTKAEAINHFQHQNVGSGGSFSVYTSDAGDIAWTERGSFYEQVFYWSKDTGTVEINIDENLSRLGFKKRELVSTKPLSYRYYIEKLDNYGNVFLSINFDMREEAPSWLTGHNIIRVGVWNKKFGFKLLNIPGIDSVVRTYFSNGLLCVCGYDKTANEKLVVLRSLDGQWPWEDPKLEAVEEPVEQTPETTPWDRLPYGKHSSRLHILQQLLKNTKKSDEKKTVFLMIETEVATLLDVLHYDLKRSQALIDRATSDGRQNSEAELTRTETANHIKALQGYMKSLPKDNRCHIADINLPSSQWIPQR